MIDILISNLINVDQYSRILQLLVQKKIWIQSIKTIPPSAHQPTDRQNAILMLIVHKVFIISMKRVFNILFGALSTKSLKNC